MKQPRRPMKLQGGPCHRQVLNVFVNDIDPIITFDNGAITYRRIGDLYVYQEKK